MDIEIMQLQLGKVLAFKSEFEDWLKTAKEVHDPILAGIIERFNRLVPVFEEVETRLANCEAQLATLQELPGMIDFMAASIARLQTGSARYAAPSDEPEFIEQAKAQPKAKRVRSQPAAMTWDQVKERADRASPPKRRK